jgi:hypothetical protein
MHRQQSILAILTLVIASSVIAILWVQTGLPTAVPYQPRISNIQGYPTVYAFWIPAIYLVFSAIWGYLVDRTSPDSTVRFFLKLDWYSYSAILVFLLLLVNWRVFGAPNLWFRGFVLMLLLGKIACLFRVFYHAPRRIHPILLVVVGIGLHLLLVPLTYQSLTLSINDLLQQAQLLHLSRILIKSFFLNLMTLEMFRLATELTRSPRSAFFSWLLVTFSFPVLSFPKISHILAGLLIIFILRMVFSRLNTRELMFGLFTPTNILILLKLLVIVGLLAAAGVVFWTNVRPGFGFHGRRMLDAAIGTLWDGQTGLLCYTPIYWMAGLGVVYVFFFTVWDGVLLTLISGLVYLGYHLAFYGMLGFSVEQRGSLLFIPMLGAFMAIAHVRFGKMALFRFGVRFAVIVTVSLTCLLLLTAPNAATIVTKMAELHRAASVALGRDLSYLLPSMAFRPLSARLFIWIGSMILLALLFCNARTRSVSLVARQTRRAMEQYLHFQEFSFTPFVVCLGFVLAAVAFHYGDERHSVLHQPIRLTAAQPHTDIPIPPTGSGHPTNAAIGLLVVSHLNHSTAVAHHAPVVNISVMGREQRFETFLLRAGQDTAEEMLEQPAIKRQLAHGRAAVYRSRPQDVGGLIVAAHDYYTILCFSTPLYVQSITLKLLDADSDSPLPEVTIQIVDLALMRS